MRRLALVLFAALIGCGSSDDDRASANTTVDAAGPVTPHDGSAGGPGSSSDVERTPFTTTGTTPGGALDDVRFMSVEYIGGYCPGTYYLKLYRTEALEDEAMVTFGVTKLFTGTITASAYAGAATTDQVSFEIVQLDIPSPDDTQTPTVRIAGRLTITAPGWNVDFDVDATTPHKICLIL